MVLSVTLSDTKSPTVDPNPVISEPITVNDAEVQLTVTVSEATVTVMNSEPDSKNAPLNLSDANQVRSAFEVIVLEPTPLPPRAPVFQTQPRKLVPKKVIVWVDLI